MQFVYQAKFEDTGEGEILVTMPDVPMVATVGRDHADALASAADALAVALRHMVKHDEVVPLPATPAGADLTPVALGTFDALKLAVVLAFRDARLSKTEFARRLGRGDSEAHRILDPHHSTKIATLEASLAVLGKRAVVDVVEVA